MGTQKENLKKIFSDSRSRNVIILTGFLLVVMVIVGIVALKDRFGGEENVTGSTKVSGRGAARVRSIPGALRPSDEYAKLVQKANVDAAERAKKSGSSAIPTIVKTKELSEGNIPLMPKNAVKGVPFSTLSRSNVASRGIWFNNLVRDNCSVEAIQKARQAGARMADLRAAGCTVKQLLAAGDSLSQLKEAGYSASELRAAGFTAAQLRAAGFGAADLRNAGFSACELKAAGYTVEELRAAGFSDGELRGAGFSAQEIAGSSGLPVGMTEEDLINLSCEKDGVLSARKRGVSAKKVRSLLGIEAKKLVYAGYSWSDLHDAGYNALELLKSGADCELLKEAGYRVQDLVETNVCKPKLAMMGISADQVRTAEAALDLPAGLSIEQLAKSGCGAEAVTKAKAIGITAGRLKRTLSCPALALRHAGYTPRQLRNAGYTANQVAGAGVSASDLKAAGFSDDQAKAASMLPGCISIDALQKSGCDPESLSELRRQGVTVEHIKEYNGCSAGTLMQAGFSAADLKKAGYTAQELSKAGQSCSQLRLAGATAVELLESGICNEGELLAAGFSAEEITAAKNAKLNGGYTAAQLRAIAGIPDALSKARTAGVNASDLRRLGGFDARTLRNAGYTANELLDVGYSPRELLKAGFTEAELRAAGISADEIRLSRNLPGGISEQDIRQGCCSNESITKSRRAGVDAYSIHEIAGCSARSLRSGGFGAEDLLDAGFTAQELKMTGFDCGQLVRGGASAAVLMEAKLCSASDLLDAGFTPVQISAAQHAIKLPGAYTGAKLIHGGCYVVNIRQARRAGIDAGHYRRMLNCSAQSLRMGGYAIADLQRAGYSARELLHGGFSENDILRSGYTQSQLDSAMDLACIACSSQSSLKAGGCSKLSLSDARTSDIAAADIRDIINCSAVDLKTAGYEAAELHSAGVIASQLKKAGFTCRQLHDSGLTIGELLVTETCSMSELSQAGFSAAQLDNVSPLHLSSGYKIETFLSGGCRESALKTSRQNGVTAGEVRRLLGCDAQVLKKAGFLSGELKQSGYSAHQLKRAGYSAEELRVAGFSAKALRNACFTVAELKAAGFSASDLAKAGFSADALLKAGFSVADLKEAGFSAKELLAAGVSVKELADAGYSTKALMAAGVTAKDLIKAGIGAEALNADVLKAAGVSATAMKKAGYTCAQLHTMGYQVADMKQAGCSAAELLAAGVSIQALKDAGFTAKELLGAGVPVKELLKSFSVEELKQAGVSAEELIEAGVKPRALLDAGFTVQDLRDAGMTPENLRKAGLSAAELLAGGFSEADVRKAGYTTAQLGDAGILPVAGIPGQGSGSNNAAQRANQQLEEVYRRQTAQIDAQKFQQQIQKRLTKMQGETAKMVAAWHGAVLQSYAVGRTVKDEDATDKSASKPNPVAATSNSTPITDSMGNEIHKIKAGDILYAVLDTSINSDETAPILATITHGPLKGAKLIGTMTRPDNATSVLVTFNTLSLKQMDHSIAVTAYAIDQNTARTALASRVDNHFLLKYGSIIATSFLDGFGQAFMQQGTSISTNAGSTTVSVDSRTAGQAALVGLGKLGQKLGQAATEYQNKPPTVYVYSGTPIGVFFTADMAIK